MKKTVIFLSFFVVILMILSTGCTGTALGSTSSANNLQILEHHMEKPQYGMVSVAGTVQNIGSSTISYGSVRVRFYDKNGVLVGDGLANIDDLNPGQKRAFEAFYLGLDPTNSIYSYQINARSIR
jgi:hypothetical protein